MRVGGRGGKGKRRDLNRGPPSARPSDQRLGPVRNVSARLNCVVPAFNYRCQHLSEVIDCIYDW
jgi:hypothetical protein